MIASLRSCVSIVAALALLPACVATTPQVDVRFGQSVRAMLASQVVDPAAVRNVTPVNGIDGRAARGALQRYEDSFGKAGDASRSGPAVPVSVVPTN